MVPKASATAHQAPRALHARTSPPIRAVQNKAAVPDGVDVAETRATDRGKRLLLQIRGENISICQAEGPCIPRAPIEGNVVYARV